jgi:hypothetical protein
VSLHEPGCWEPAARVCGMNSPGPCHESGPGFYV